jgi:SAM-dependent methyltransferase
MAPCCYADEYEAMFPARAARRTARRFVRRGLRGSALRLADDVAARGISGATILEVGGGVGQVHADLLRRGAARAVNVELSPSWEAAAASMLGALGLTARVERRVGDFVADAEDLPEADVVLLHRVVCCYPDWPAMLAAATAKARRVVGLTLPVDRRASRVAIAAGNRLLQLQRRAFRAYVHPPAQVIAALGAAGLRTTADSSGPVWRTVVAERG